MGKAVVTRLHAYNGHELKLQRLLLCGTAQSRASQKGVVFLAKEKKKVNDAEFKKLKENLKL